MENKTSSTTNSTRRNPGWKLFWWLTGIAIAVTVLSLAYQYGRVYVFPNLHPTREVFMHEISFRQPGVYRFTADVPWRGRYRLSFYLSIPKEPCDDKYLRKMFGDPSYRRAGEPPADRGLNWPFSWQIHVGDHLQSKGEYSPNLFWEEKNHGISLRECRADRKLATIELEDERMVSIDINIAKSVVVAENAKTSVRLWLMQPTSKSGQIAFAIMPALDLFSALLWRGYRILWFWVPVVVIGLLLLSDRLSSNRRTGT